MACAQCEERRKALKEAFAARDRGDMETYRRLALEALEAAKALASNVLFTPER